MTGLPRSIIKKYGVTKKAWSVFRSGKSGSTKKKTKVRRNENMAKKKRYSKGRGFGGGKLMTGLYKPSGILGSVVMGLGAAAVASKLPVSMPYKEEIAAGLVGGLPGAGAVYLLKRSGALMTGSSSGIALN